MAGVTLGAGNDMGTWLGGDLRIGAAMAATAGAWGRGDVSVIARGQPSRGAVTYITGGVDWNVASGFALGTDAVA